MLVFPHFSNYFAVKKKELLVQVHKTKQITSAAGIYQWLAAQVQGFPPSAWISVFILSKISNWSCLKCFPYKNKNVTRSNSGLREGDGQGRFLQKNNLKVWGCDINKNYL